MAINRRDRIWIASLALILLCKTPCVCQAPLPIDSAFQLIRHRAILRSSTDWAIAEKGFHEKLRKAHTALDSIQALVYVYECMNDYHSQVWYGGSVYGNYPAFSDSSMAVLRPLVVRSQEQSGHIFSKRLPGKVIYIQVPEIMAWGDEVDVAAKKLADELGQYGNKKVKGIIVDLRLNSGGQLSAMAAGLASVLGDGYLGGGVDEDGQETHRFELNGGNFFIGGVAMTHIRQPYPNAFVAIPVAVILGPTTRSSGSIAAILFRGRKRTVFIGEPTADGYTTGNDVFYFANGLVINLATEYNQDRSHQVFPNSVPVDIPLSGGSDFEDLGKDTGVQRALRWFRENRRP